MHVEHRFSETDVWQALGTFNAIAMSKNISMKLQFNKNLQHEYDLKAESSKNGHVTLMTGTLEQVMLGVRLLTNFMKLL